MWGPSPPPCLNMYVEALSEHTHREAFRSSFSPESPLPWLCGCFWNLSKQKPPGYYWPSLEVGLCPFFLELSMTALPFSYFATLKFPLSQREEPTFLVSYCVVRLSGRTSFLDEPLEQGRWFAHLRTLLGAFLMLMRRLEGSWQREHLLCTVPAIMYASHWSMPGSPEQGGVHLFAEWAWAQRAGAGGHPVCGGWNGTQAYDYSKHPWSGVGWVWVGFVKLGFSVHFESSASQATRLEGILFCSGLGQSCPCLGGVTWWGDVCGCYTISKSSCARP